MAICVSVTVSMLEETMGLLRKMLRVRRVLTEIRRRDVTDERLGTRSTSSKVIPDRMLAISCCWGANRTSTWRAKEKRTGEQETRPKTRWKTEKDPVEDHLILNPFFHPTSIT